MKVIAAVLFFLILCGCTTTATMESESIGARISLIEDKAAIKNIVDVFSNLADSKEIDKQVLLFTEDGEVESITNGRSNVLKGREQLKQAFSTFLANFHTVYHQNGQQTIEELTSDSAKATSYCRVILVGNQNGKQIKTTLYAIYKDKFVKRDGQWLIEKRQSNFVWREVEEVK